MDFRNIPSKYFEACVAQMVSLEKDQWKNEVKFDFYCTIMGLLEMLYSFDQNVRKYDFTPDLKQLEKKIRKTHGDIEYLIKYIKRNEEIDI